ncbi:hypothetical protein [Arthrobacter sp. D2-10]
MTTNDMATNDDGVNVPIQVELVPEGATDSASRIPGAVAAAAIAPSAALAFFAADDGATSVYSDPAALRAGDSGQTYTGVAEPGPEASYAGSLDATGADGGGE